MEVCVCERLTRPDGLATRARCIALGLQGSDAGRRERRGRAWDGALMVLLLICCPEVQLLAVRELGDSRVAEYCGRPKGR
eukprot:6024309-Alexandrium_andersonii.AAC.1